MTEIVKHQTNQQLILNDQSMETMKNVAKLMAQATVQVPVHLMGKPADCLAVVMQAAQWNMNPFVVAQKTHVINGTLGYEAQLVNAVVSSSRAIVGRFHYEYKGERNDWKPNWVKEARNGKETWKPQFSEKCAVRVGAIIAGETEITWGEWIYPCDQTVFNSPLWRSNPKQQSGYLAVKFWARAYTPDVLLGVYTPDEFEPMAKDITPPKSQPKSGSAMEKLSKVAKKADQVIEQSPIYEGEAVEQEISEADVTYEEFMWCITETSGTANLSKLANDVAVCPKLNEPQKSELIRLISEKRQQA
jgi:hypothetical protein